MHNCIHCIHAKNIVGDGQNAQCELENHKLYSIYSSDGFLGIISENGTVKKCEDYKEDNGNE